MDPLLKTIVTETQAIQDCYGILKKLSEQGQERVVAYLVSLLELDLEPPTAPPADEDFDEEDD